MFSIRNICLITTKDGKYFIMAVGRRHRDRHVSTHRLERGIDQDMIHHEARHAALKLATSLQDMDGWFVWDCPCGARKNRTRMSDSSPRCRRCGTKSWRDVLAAILVYADGHAAAHEKMKRLEIAHGLG